MSDLNIVGIVVGIGIKECLLESESKWNQGIFAGIGIRDLKNAGI